MEVIEFKRKLEKYSMESAFKVSSTYEYNIFLEYYNNKDKDFTIQLLTVEMLLKLIGFFCNGKKQFNRQIYINLFKRIASRKYQDDTLSKQTLFDIMHLNMMVDLPVQVQDHRRIHRAYKLFNFAKNGADIRSKFEKKFNVSIEDWITKTLFLHTYLMSISKGEIDKKILGDEWLRGLMSIEYKKLLKENNEMLSYFKNEHKIYAFNLLRIFPIIEFDGKYEIVSYKNIIASLTDSLVYRFTHGSDEHRRQLGTSFEKYCFDTIKSNPFYTSKYNVYEEFEFDKKTNEKSADITLIGVEDTLSIEVKLQSQNLKLRHLDEKTIKTHMERFKEHYSQVLKKMYLLDIGRIDLIKDDRNYKHYGMMVTFDNPLHQDKRVDIVNQVIKEFSEKYKYNFEKFKGCVALFDVSMFDNLFVDSEDQLSDVFKTISEFNETIRSLNYRVINRKKHSQKDYFDEELKVIEQGLINGTISSF